jgi:hypothetical protein
LRELGTKNHHQTNKYPDKAPLWRPPKELLGGGKHRTQIQAIFKQGDDCFQPGTPTDSKKQLTIVHVGCILQAMQESNQPSPSPLTITRAFTPASPNHRQWQMQATKKYAYKMQE